MVSVKYLASVCATHKLKHDQANSSDLVIMLYNEHIQAES